MSRERIDLNGTWSFGTASAYEPTPPPAGDRAVTVPQTYQSAFLDLFSHTGYTVYRRSGLYIPADWEAGDTVLHFDAVSYWCEVWLNGQRLASHEGGYTPFELSLGDAVVYGGTNEIALWVLTPPIDDPDYPFQDIPHGKQDWYGPAGGIWQDVYLERRPKTRIDTVYVTPDITAERAAAAVVLGGHPSAWTSDGAEPYELQLTVHDGPDSAAPVVARGENSLKDPAAVQQVGLEIPSPRLWSPEEPNLYSLVVTLTHSGRPVDQQSVCFGMRSVGTRDGQFLLNGAPYYVIGALDQDFYPYTGYTPPSRAYLEDQFRKAKAMGLNLLRCHIKIPHPYYLEIADRLGMLIWYDLPNWGISSNHALAHHTTDAAVKRGETLMEEAIQLDFNHPSVAIRTLINENWGPDLVGNADHRAWLKGAYDRFKAQDPSRLLVDNSACCNNFHVKSDIDDFHIYFSMPDHRGAFDAWIVDFAGRPSWTYSDDPIAERTRTEPLMLSEFGNWGMPELAPLLQSYGGRPDWMQRRVEETVTGEKKVTQGEEVIDTSRVQDAFQASGMSSVFNSFDEFARHSQALQFQAVKHQILRIREQEAIRGYVITELTDIQWESNGMLDMARNPKVHFGSWSEVNAPDLVIPRVERYAVRSGEEIRLPLVVSHYSARDLDGGSIRWHASPGSEEGRLELSAVPRGAVTEAGPITISFEAQRPLRAELAFGLYGRDGALVHETRLHIGVYPARPLADLSASLYCRHETLRGHLQSQGARMAEQMDRADVAFVVGEPAADELSFVENGGSLVVAFAEAGAYRIGDRRLTVVPREGVLSGDWATNNNWIATSVFSHLPTDGVLGFECEGIAGDLLVQSGTDGTPLAGLVVGWAHDGGSYCLTLPGGGGGSITAITVPVDRMADSAALASFVSELLRHVIR